MGGRGVGRLGVSAHLCRIFLFAYEPMACAVLLASEEEEIPPSLFPLLFLLLSYNLGV